MPDYLIRKVERDDLLAISRLVVQCGFPHRSPAGWAWIVFANPDQGDIPPGWVYLHEGRVIAFVGNFVTSYQCAGEPLRIATGHTAVSDLSGPRRQAGMKLMRHAKRQTGVDAFLTLNNNKVSAPLLPRIGLEPWLDRASCGWAEWVTNPLRLLQGKLPVPRGAGESFERPPDIDFELPVRRGGFEFVSLAAARRADFSLLNRGPGVRRAVSHAHLRYRLDDPDRMGGSGYRVCLRGGEVMALAGLSLTKPAPDRLDFVEVADWIAVGGPSGRDAEIALLQECLRITRESRAAKLRLAFHRSVHPDALKAAGWYIERQHAHIPCHGDIRSPALRDWRPGPGDADFFFSLRIPPACRSAAAREDHPASACAMVHRRTG